MKALLFATAMALGISVSAAQAETELVVGYPYDIYFKDTHRLIAEQFEKDNPGVKVTFRAAYKNYEDATQKVLKESITESQPDVSFQGLNRFRIFADRDLAVPLDDFVAGDDGFQDHGLKQAILDIGTVGGKVYGLPFSISTPIVYVNVDLMKEAGFEADYCPATWDAIIELAAKIDEIPKSTGIFFGWDITGNWLNQALIFSQGGKLISDDETTALLDSKEGIWAMETMASLVKETKMRGYAWKEGNAEFGAGRLGMYIWSTSSIGTIDRLRGDKFAMKTCPFPLNEKYGEPGSGRLPTGGNGAMMHTTDPEKQKVAWEYIKAVTSPYASTVVVETTGYMPVNSKAVESPDYLANFYDENPSHKTSINQLPVSTFWYAWPGKNAIKITDVIKDYNESIVSRDRSDEVGDVVKDMQADVQGLLPN